MILIYDTETTGLPPRNATLGQQPRLVQLGAAIFDSFGNEKASIDLLIQPDGEYEVPEPAAAVHGITTGMAQSFGVPRRTVLTLFHRMRERASVVVGHNIEYDENIMLGEFHRANFLDVYKKVCVDQLVQCTALLSEPVIKIPPTERMIRWGHADKFKKPNLQEAHRHFLGVGFEGAHSALVDVRACARIFFKLRELGHV